MRRRLATLTVLTWMFFGALAAQNTYVLPQIANGQFPGGSVRTTFIVSNTGGRTADVALTALDDDGEPMVIPISELGTASTFELSLVPGETRFLQTEGGGVATAGSARVVSNIPIGVSAIFTLLDPTDRPLTEAGVGVSDPLTEFVIAVDTTGAGNTGLAVTNLEAEETSLTLTLWGPEGERRGDPVELVIPGDGHVARFISGELFPLLGDFRGQLRVKAGGAVAALTLRQNALPLSFTTLPVVPAESSETEHRLPQIANGGGRFRTTLVLFNLSTTAANRVAIRLSDADGGPFSVGMTDGPTGSEFEVELPAFGVRFLETDGAGVPMAGAARISAQRPVGVAAILSAFDLLGRLVTQAGVGPSVPAATATIPVDQTGTRSTGIALFNDSEDTAVISFQFTDASGGGPGLPPIPIPFPTPVDSAPPIALPPGHHLARLANELAPGIDGRTGSLAFESTVPLAAVTLRQDTSPDTLTTLPVFEGIFAGPGRILSRSVEGVEIVSDTVLDQALPEALELAGGVSLPNSFDRLARAAAVSASGEVYSGNAIGSRYRFVLPPGTYTLRFEYQLTNRFLFPTPQGSGQTSSSVMALAVVEGVELESNTLRNFRFDAPDRSAVSGEVGDLTAVLPPELLSFDPSLNFDSRDSATPSATAVIQPDGSYEVRLADGEYSVSLAVADILLGQPPLIRQLAFLPLGRVTVEGSDVEADFAAPDIVRLSGTVSLPDAAEIPLGSSVLALSTTAGVAAFDLAFSNGGVTADGQYRTVVVRDQPYQVRASLPVLGADPTTSGSLSIPVPATEESFAEDTVRDFEFPRLPETVTLSGRVTGPLGPVPNIPVTATSRSLSATPGVEFSVTTITGPNGSYSFQVYPGTDYTVTFFDDIPITGNLILGTTGAARE